MKFKDGKYLNTCGFNLCGCEFYGRLNQIYCSPKCKQAQNNRKSSMVNKVTKGADTKIRKAVRILMKIFKKDQNGRFVISAVDLASMSFPFDLPTLLIKDDRCSRSMHSFGSYCFYRHEEFFIFYKI
jgi:hypothetical protein